MEEIIISPEEAKEKYGITCEHSRMPNGELRFRLKKDDGTTYIRTESSPTSGWQQSHYHNKVKETYIVQRGWVGYVELINNTMYFKIYKEGQSFTTRPFIIHNIYMPKSAVTHTVKHGDSKGEQRLEDDRSRKFTEMTKGISERELKRKAKLNNETIQNITDYNEPYRHFDNLIWQVPAWSSGIFAAILLGTINLKENNILVTISGLSGKTLLCLVYGIMSIFIFFLSYTLFRFRWHQIRVKNYTPKYHFRSPQVGLQFIINVQFIILLFFSFSFISSFLWLKLVIVFILLTILMIYEEKVLLKESKKGNRPVSTSS